VIENETSNSLLLGRPWIHANGIVPSTLHQSFKYSTLTRTVKYKDSLRRGSLRKGRGLKPIARTQRCTYASDPEDEENEAEAHLEEVEAKSGPKGKYVIHINNVIGVKKCVVNVMTLDTPIPPMEKARWSKGFRIQLPLPPSPESRAFKELCLL